MKPTHQILIVEDEMIISMELAQTLRRLGYGIAGQVTKGEDAIELAGKVKPDLVLMDIVLQGEIDGIGAAELIWNRYHIPVIFLTAHSDKATLERAIAIQPSGYLIKPFRDRELYSTIELSLHKQDIRRRLMPQSLINQTDSDIPHDLPCLLVAPDWTITWANSCAYDFLKMPPGSLIHTHFDHLIVLIHNHHVTMPDEMYVQNGNGGHVPVTITLGAMINEQESVTGYVLVLQRRDVPAV